MDWKTIPSLSALRAFEAAARLQNQSAAAAELNVTHAAINQHIRALERQFGLALFRRKGKHVVLTPEGARFHEGLAQGFAQINTAVHDLRRSRDTGMLKISVTPSFHERWLIGKIPEFRALHPEIHLDVSTDSRLVNLESEGFDLALRFGKGVWPPLRSVMFWKGRNGIFAGADYARKHPNLGQNLKDAVWICAEDSPEFYPLHNALGIDFNDPKHWKLTSNMEARSALMAGHGVLAQNHDFLEAEIKYGLVVEIAPVQLHPQYGYYAVYSENRFTPSTRKFVDWLRSQANSE